LGIGVLIRQTVLARRSADAARDAAKAARDNAQVVINTERAWIVVELRPHFYQGKDNRWYHEDHRPLTTEEVLSGKHLVYSLRITNKGNTPAQLLRFETGYTCLPEGVKDLPEHIVDGVHGVNEINLFLVAGDGIELEGPSELVHYMEPHWPDIQSLKQTAVFYGSVYYKHMFSAKEESRSDYCYVYTVSLARLSRVGRHTRYT